MYTIYNIIYNNIIYNIIYIIYNIYIYINKDNNFQEFFEQFRGLELSSRSF